VCNRNNLISEDSTDGDWWPRDSNATSSRPKWRQGVRMSDWTNNWKLTIQRFHNNETQKLHDSRVDLMGNLTGADQFATASVCWYKQSTNGAGAELPDQEYANAHRSLVFPASKIIRDTDLTPAAIMIIRSICNIEPGRMVFVVFDSGSNGSLIHSRCLPKGCTPRVSEKKEITTTANGTFGTSRSVSLNELEQKQIYE